MTEINRCLLEHSLSQHRTVTLDMDATLLESKNKNAQWTYKKCTGYIPMVSHLAETGQVVATDFREGNIAPATNNLAFSRFLDSHGELVEGESTTRLVHTMEKSQHAFSVVVQRRLLKGQHQFLDNPLDEESAQLGQYLYRAIAVSHHHSLSG